MDVATTGKSTRRSPVINWKKVWKKHQQWFDRETARRQKLGSTCSQCGRYNLSLFPDWDEQQAKIQELVEKEVACAQSI